MAELGAHESVAGGLYKAFDRIRSVGGESLQIFTRNQRQWKPKPLTETEVVDFRAAWEKNEGMKVASHASYLANPATGKVELQAKTEENLALELERCAALGIPWLVLHPGSHTGDGVELGLDRVASSLDRIFERADNGVQILLETTAGQGTGLGSRFEELGGIIERSSYPDLLGVCVDTCHIFAAGYELRSQEGYRQTMQALEDAVGLGRVKFFHLNDSKKDLGSRVDRHEHIGQGCIGLDGFRNLLTDPRFATHPMTLETPKGDDLVEDRENLERLRTLY